MAASSKPVAKKATRALIRSDNLPMAHSALVLGPPAVLAEKATDFREPFVRIEVRHAILGQKERLVRELETDAGHVLFATDGLVQEARHWNWVWRFTQALNRLGVQVDVEQVVERDAQRTPESRPGKVQLLAFDAQ